MLLIVCLHQLVSSCLSHLDVKKENMASRAQIVLTCVKCNSKQQWEEDEVYGCCSEECWQVCATLKRSIFSICPSRFTEVTLKEKLETNCSFSSGN